MALTHQVSRPYLKVCHDFVYQIPFLESLRRHLSDRLVFEEVHGLNNYYNYASMFVEFLLCR